MNANDSLDEIITDKMKEYYYDLYKVQIYKPYPSNYNPKGWSRIEKIIQDKLGIERTQFWLLLKR